MIGEQLGAYAIHSELGSGGMGTVYLAETVEAAAGLEPGTMVALKVVHPHLLATPGFFKRFLLEADLGKRVRHENVVRTFDVDAITHGGQNHHYMVMEYVKGKSLRDLLIELGTIPETLLREVALQTGAGLSAIHEAGIVHRDLKPENILITDDHQIRIMDLGVAKLQEASLALTREGQFAGSFLYAAPEQFKSEPVGPAADLYSFGVLLYELATGENPFRSYDVSAVIHAHLDEIPPRAHGKNEDVSLFFSELVARLLQKEPSDRFASAEELHAVLSESERSAWWIEYAPALRSATVEPPKIRVNRETKLHGRDQALAELRADWGRAKAGEGNTVFIEGEAGIGKTRLVDAFLSGFEDRDMHVLYGCYPPSGGMGGLSDAIVEKFGPVGLSEALAPYLTVTPTLVDAFAALIQHEVPPDDAEPLSGEALQSVLVHLMRALAADRPTVWVVDDLHFASQESRGILLALARAVEDHRVLLVVTARPGVGLEDFSRLTNFRRTFLERLGGREIIELLEDAFRSEDLAEKLGVRITKKSDGVPFFIFEMIRGLKEGQFIRQQDDGTYVQTQVIDEIEVPSAVKDLIEGRMRGLTEDQRAILDAGAVQGMAFEPALVANVLDEKKVLVLRQIAEIERRFGLVHGEAGLCRFDQNQIQELLYRDLLPDLRSEYHTLLAEAHAERAGTAPEGSDAVFLVHHHLHGSDPQEALPLLNTAFEHLKRVHRNEALLDLARRALQVDGLLAGEARAELLLHMADALELLGKNDERRVVLNKALSLADATGKTLLRASARRALGVLFIHESKHDDAEAVLKRALELATEADDVRLTARISGMLGVVRYRQSRHAEAQELLERQRKLAIECGDSESEASACSNLGLVFFGLDRYADARGCLETSMRIAEERRDRRVTAVATGNLGLVLWNLGRRSEAKELFERHRSISRELGFRRAEAIATGNHALILSDMGWLADSRAQLLRALALNRECGGRRGEAICESNFADLCILLGRHAEAETRAQRGLALGRETEYRQVEGASLRTLASLADLRGDVAEARRLYADSLAFVRKWEHVSDIVTTLIESSRLEITQGETETAVALLDEATDILNRATHPRLVLLAATERVRLPDADLEEATRVLTEYQDRCEIADQVRLRFRLWQKTDAKLQLAEAHRLLEFVRDHAPEEDRVSMIENVPLHRDIMAAWDAHAGRG